MATAHVTFGAAMGGGAPVLSPIPAAAQTITTSGSSQASTIAARGGDYATVATDGAVFVAFGQAPVAATNRGYYLPAGSAFNFGPLKEGDKAAVIDAA